MKKYVRLISICVVIGFGPSIAGAAISPVAVAIVPPVQFPANDFSITGLRASVLWGNHRDFYGLDLGLIGNITEQSFVGLGVSGIFNVTHGTTTVVGLQAAGAANINTNKTSVIGLQFALGINSNRTTSSVTGLQVAGIANLSAFSAVYGAQIGIYNSAQDVYGIQIGIVNFAKSLHGIQIGLVNFNDKGPFVVSPILNVGF